MTSDGAHRFRNDEMGLSAVFPAGSRVCLARSGNAARGFYAWYGTDEPGCPERGDIRATYMSLSASFNSGFHRTLAEAVPNCRPPAGAIARQLAGVRLALPGHASLVCEERGDDARVEIAVQALAGEWPGEPREEAPFVLYRASLGTTPERLAQDLDMLRAFLATARIGGPAH